MNFNSQLNQSPLNQFKLLFLSKTGFFCPGFANGFICLYSVIFLSFFKNQCFMRRRDFIKISNTFGVHNSG